MALVQVTPENAALWGFDRIGQTINTDTGGIVNPFEGPADGIDGRASRNAAIAARGPGRVLPGYSQIMSDPRNRAFNERLLNDPQFAWSNLQEGFGNQVDGNNPMLFYNGNGGAVSAVQRRPGFAGNTTSAAQPNAFRFGGTPPPATTTPPKTDPLTGGPVYDTRGGTGTIDGESGGPPLAGNPTPRPEFSVPPSYSNSTSSPSSNSTADSGQGLFGIGNQNTYDPNKAGSAFQSAGVPGVQKATAEYNPRDGVVNAMTKQFKAKSWF